MNLIVNKLKVLETTYFVNTIKHDHISIHISVANY